MNKLAEPATRKFHLVSESGKTAEIEIPVQLEEETPEIALDREQGMFNYYYHETPADHPWLFGIRLEPGDEWCLSGESGFVSLTAWRNFPWEAGRTTIDGSGTVRI